MTLLENGDYIDEVFFVATETSKAYRIVAWDLDDLFSPCHFDGDFAFADPYGLLHCTEARIDHVMFADPGIYARFVDILEETLATVDKARFEAALATAVAGVLDYMADDDVRRAMVEPLADNPGAHARAEAERDIRARAEALALAFARRHGELRARVARYRRGQ